jgi:hypothetical protein
VLFSALVCGSQAAGQPFTQQGPKLVGAGTVGNAQQGTSVAVAGDGNTIIVGGPTDNGGMGAAWVFTRNGGTWTQQGPKLVGTGAVGNAGQGTSISVAGDGNTFIVGGPNDNGSMGAAWVFTRNAGVWTQQGPKLVGTGAVGNALQGTSISVSGGGNTIIVGGSNDNGGMGAAWVFTLSGGVWTQQGSKLVGTGANTGLFNCSVNQGASVALSADGNTAIVGGPGDNTGGACAPGGGVGAVWVFTQTAGVWSQQGSKLVNTAIPGEQGYSVALSADGNTAGVGGATGGGVSSGVAGVFVRSGGVWNQQGGALNCASGQQIGFASTAPCFVALSAAGNTAIFGGSGRDLGPGAALVFTRNGGVWTQQAQLVGNGAVGTFQSKAVALSADANTAIVGGPSDNSAAGAAWVFVQPASLLAAVLPEGRSVQVGGTATAFATIINTGTTAGTSCSIAPASGPPATFLYQTTNPATNALTGSANTPVNIAAGASQSFVIALTPSAPIAPTNELLIFACTNTAAASIVTGLNTLLLSASATQTPDVIALAATLQNDGIVHVTNGSPPTGVFAVATDNLGSGDTITVATNTGAATLPITVTVCQTNPTTGACLQARSATVTTTISSNATPTFAFFVAATNTVPFDPANSRIFVTFTDSTNAVRGETSVAVETQ